MQERFFSSSFPFFSLYSCIYERKHGVAQHTTLTPDTSLTRQVGDIKIRLQLDGTLKAGQENTLRFAAVDGEGQSLDQEIAMLSGNEANLSVIDDKLTTFLRQPLSDLNKLQFSVNFPKPGTYKVWFDFLYQSQPEQISFVLDVK